MQTSCNFKAKLRDRYCHLGDVHCLFSITILESRDDLVVWCHSNISVSSNLELRLNKDIPHPPSSSKSSASSRSTTEQNKLTEHSGIQNSLSRAIWLQVTLVAYCLPYGVVTALATSGGRSSSVSSYVCCF